MKNAMLCILISCIFFTAVENNFAANNTEYISKKATNFK